jgi:hypothetical protein
MQSTLKSTSFQSGFGLDDQQNSFLGKLTVHPVVFAVLIFGWACAIVHACRDWHNP